MEQNLSYYHIFNVVAKTENISRASKELFISQPAISKAIKQLETNLSTTLFIRTSRGVLLSEDGKILYEHTKNAFSEIEMGEQYLKRINELEVGNLKIGVSSTLCRFLLLPYLKPFVKKHPHIKIQIECRPSLETIPLLENGSLDIGLIVNTKSVSCLSYLPVGEIEDIFVCTPTYLENLKKRELGPNMDFFYCGNLMLMDKKNMTRQHIDQYIATHNIKTKQILEVNSMDLLIEFAKTGLGIAGVIKSFVEEELENGTLIELPLECSIPKRQVCFAYRNYAHYQKGARAFLEFVNCHE